MFLCYGNNENRQQQQQHQIQQTDDWALGVEQLKQLSPAQKERKRERGDKKSTVVKPPEELIQFKLQNLFAIVNLFISNL